MVESMQGGDRSDGDASGGAADNGDERGSGGSGDEKGCDEGEQLRVPAPAPRSSSKPTGKPSGKAAGPGAPPGSKSTPASVSGARKQLAGTGTRLGQAQTK